MHDMVLMNRLRRGFCGHAGQDQKCVVDTD